MSHAHKHDEDVSITVSSYYNAFMGIHDRNATRLERFADRRTSEQLSVFLSHFASSLRLRLLCHLVCGGRQCVSDLAEWAGESQPVVSRQLKLLWNARLVEREKVGIHAYYSVTDAVVMETMEFLARLADRVSQPAGWGVNPGSQG